MSFWPFPKTLLDECVAAASIGPWVEIGAGSGRLTSRLTEVLGPGAALDRRADVLSGVPRAVAADARALPFATASIGACILADLLRHLSPADRLSTARECARVLRTGGRVIVMEDVPAARDPAESNYRRALELLAAVDPSRGVAVQLHVATAALHEEFGASVREGIAENEDVVVDPFAPVRWIRARVTGPGSRIGSQLDALEEAVHAHGMRYGRYAFAVYRRG